MIATIDERKMGKSDMGWLHSTFHFSFAEYFNQNNMQFGVIRVINDDIIDPDSGFDTHPHSNMEIVSYVVDGTLTHKDSMGNKRELTRGQVQYMSAGTGVRHSEHNRGDKPLRLLQIWILPDKDGYPPQYGDYQFDWELREKRWLKLVSGVCGDAPIKIRQDAQISVIYLSAGESSHYSLLPGRKAYLIQIEGEGSVNSFLLKQRDAAEITNESTISLTATTDAHYMIFDLSE